MKRTGIKNREKIKKQGLPSLAKPTMFFILLVIVGIIGMIVVIFYVDKETNLEFSEKTQQYYGTDVTYFEKGSVISNQEMATIIRQGDTDYSVDPTPFYALDSKRMYLSKSYSWVCFEDNSYWRIPEFTCMTLNNNVYHCQLNNYSFDMSSGFLVDNNCNYIFLESGTLNLNGQIFKLSPMSFYSQEYGVVRIYDYDSDRLEVIEDKVKKSTLTFSGGYAVELAKGIMTTSLGNQTILPGSPANLNNIEDRGA